MKDQDFFDLVARELQDRAIKPGLWARAIAESGQDDGRARSAYIKLRVQGLKDEAASAEIRNRPSQKPRRTAQNSNLFRTLVGVVFKPASLLIGPKVFAIAGLTWRAALRFKLFLVIAALLILAVVGLDRKSTRLN